MAVVEFESDGAHAAGDVDDAGGAALSGFEEERAEGLRDEVDACGVGVEIGEHVLAGDFLRSDGGVVGQDVEAAVGALDEGGGGGDAGVVSLVELEELAGAGVVFGSELLDGGLAFFDGAGADEDVVGAFGH